jgi:ribosomal silencing factor RsfS
MTHTDPSARFHDALDICTGYVAGVFDLSSRGGSEYTVVVKGRSAAHLRKLATRVSDALGAAPEGEAPDGSDPWLVVDADDVVVHLLTEGSLARYGLVDLFREHSAEPSDVFAVVAAERLARLREQRRAG